MTEEECNFIKTTLLSKVLDRTSALLRSIMSRIEHVTLFIKGKSRGTMRKGTFAILNNTSVQEKL